MELVIRLVASNITRDAEFIKLIARYGIEVILLLGKIVYSRTRRSERKITVVLEYYTREQCWLGSREFA